MQGDRQLEEPEPLSSLALLSYHDAIELLLSLPAARSNLKRHDSFPDLWDGVNRGLQSGDPPAQLPLKGPMTRTFNDARVTLKHKGIPAARQTCQECGRYAVRFLEDTTDLVFGVALRSVSLVDFIEEPRVRGSRSSMGQVPKEPLTKPRPARLPGERPATSSARGDRFSRTGGTAFERRAIRDLGQIGNPSR
jgi:hypothetical protein